MAWNDFQGSNLASSHSPIESDAFGVSTARVTVPLDYGGDARAIIDTIFGLSVDLVVLRMPAHLASEASSVTLRSSGYRVLHTDTLVYWELSVGEPEQGMAVASMDDPSPGTVRAAVEEIFSDYTNHYSANPLLTAMSVPIAYGDWAARHIADGKPHRSLVVDGDLAGIATYSISSDHIEILLAGVRPKYRRRGHYSSLLAAVEAHARKLAIGRVLISTQAHNYEVQRAWSRYGFLPLAAFQTFHVISDRFVTQSGLDSLSTR